MYLITCPQGHSFPVSISAAGSETNCPECEQKVIVPKLGELRQLPQQTDSISSPPRQPTQTSMGARVLFALCAFASIAAGLTAAYAAIRCYALPVPITSEFHIEQDRSQIEQLNPVELLAVWEEYEQMDFENQFPFPYQRVQNMRDDWTGVAVASLVVAGLFAGAGTLTLVVGRRSREKLDT